MNVDLEASSRMSPAGAEAGARKPRIAVCMVAYQHEQYIATAVQSILAQEGDFDLKLVIGEDCGSDNTRAICESFAEKEPSRCVLLPSPRNLGIQKNFNRVMEACLDSDYIAFCEGDDYWSSPIKLQRQLAFLESHDQYLAHTHNVEILVTTTGQTNPFGDSEDRELTSYEMLSLWPVHLVSLMVRTSLAKTIPFVELPRFDSCDRFLNRWIVCHGKAYYSGTEVMAVYRRHPHGASGAFNLIKSRYEEFEMLEFFRPLAGQSSGFAASMTSAIEGLLHFSLAQREPLRVSRSFLLKNYLRHGGDWTRRKLYFASLILGGRVSWVLANILRRPKRDLS